MAVQIDVHIRYYMRLVVLTLPLVMAEALKPEKTENLWINLAFNIAAPAIILSKFSNEQYLGTTLGLIIALLFPLCYGLWDFISRKKVNIFSILGLVSTLLTGTISLLELDPKYIAIKEAAIPGIICILVLLSTCTPFNIVEKLIFNEAIFDVNKLKHTIENHHNTEKLKGVFQNSTYLIAASFALSSVLNFVLAKVIVVSQPGTEAYNEELGKMTALSYPVIALPSTIVMAIALFYLMHQLQKLTGESIESFLAANHRSQIEQKQNSSNSSNQDT
jgi:intracellular septation protein A